MKVKLILVALAALLMTGCEKTDEPEAIKHVNGFDVVVVDSCEYIYKEKILGYKGFGFLAHKGNCRFCKERRQKELKEFIEQLKEK